MLNFPYLTSIFYNYNTICRNNFKKINLSQKDDNFDIEFEKWSSDNYFNYLDSLYDLMNGGKEINQKKIKLIRSVFIFEFTGNQKEKLL